MKIKNVLLLLLIASIWGVAFVAQNVGIDYVSPFTSNCVKCLMGGVVLLPRIWLFDREGKKRKQVPAIPGTRRALVMGGVYCSVALCLASNFQQFGIQYTTVGKAGFITARYIVIVPALGFLLGKKCSLVVAGAVALSLAGLYMLCMNDGELSANEGDLLMLVCAFLFAVHIVVIDFFSPVVNGVRMSCIQLFVSGILSGGAMLVNETPGMNQIIAAQAPVLYAGIMSCGMACTLQIVGQKGMNLTVASLILSLEPSISVLAGWVILGQGLLSRGVLGCVLVFGAVMLAQIPAGQNGEAPLNTEGDQEARYKKTANGFPIAPWRRAARISGCQLNKVRLRL